MKIAYLEFQMLLLQLSSAEWPNSRELLTFGGDVTTGPYTFGSLVYADVDGLLDTPLQPTWFPIQNVHIIKVYVMAWRLNVDMLGNFWWRGARTPMF